MHYYTHNIGEFAAQTRFLSPEEIGIYVILKDEYFANGMRLACDRIANMMPPQCEESLKRVLKRFFVEEDGYYVSETFDQELASYQDKGAKNAENAKKRWAKQKKACDPHADECDPDATASISHANRCLTNNQEPITNNHREVNLEVGRGVLRGDPAPAQTASASPLPTPTDFDSLCAEAEKLSPAELKAENPPAEAPTPAPVPTAAKERTPRKPLVPYPADLPDEWAADARLARPDIEPKRVHEKLKARYMPTTQRKTLGNWKKIFMTWIGGEYARSNDLNRGTRTGAAQSFAKIDYSAGIDPETGRIMRQEEWDRRCREAQHAVN